MKRIIVVFFLLLITSDLRAQNDSTAFYEDIYISPTISIGYTFGAGINYGIGLYIGAGSFQLNGYDYFYGATFSLDWVNVGYMRHRITTLNAMLETDYIDFTIGPGRVKYVWGHGNRNKSSSLGINYGASFSTLSKHTPWLGLKRFHFFKAEWTSWFDKPYTSTYIYFKQPPFKPSTLF